MIKVFAVTDQSMAQIVEARLSSAFNTSEEIFGTIHSKFGTVLNVLFRMPGGGSRLITFMTPAAKGVPDSITVTDEFFDKLSSLPIGSNVLCKNLSFHFDSVFGKLAGDARCLRQSNIVFGSTSSNTAGPLNFIRYTNEMKIFCVTPYFFGNLSVLNPEQKTDIVSKLHGFAKAWLEHDLTKMESILLKYIGLGIGLTPSCDDAFLGIIAVYSGARLFAEAAGVKPEDFLGEWAALPDIKSLSPFNRVLSNRTTDVSLKYLCCSQEGRFSDAVINLIKEIFSDTGDQLGTCIEAVSLVGGSSGIDMLYGMKIACHELGKSIK